MYWWDGVRWVPLIRPQQYAKPQVYAPPPPPYGQPLLYRAPDPSPGLRKTLLVVLVLADVIVGAFAALGTFVNMEYAGWLGPYDGPPGDISDTLFALYFQLVGAVLGVATVAVATRSGTWARVVTIVSGVLVSTSCVGAVLGIPIIVTAVRGSMTKPATTA